MSNFSRPSSYSLSLGTLFFIMLTHHSSRTAALRTDFKPRSVSGSPTFSQICFGTLVPGSHLPSEPTAASRIAFVEYQFCLKLCFIIFVPPFSALLIFE